MAEIHFFVNDYMASDFFGDSLDGLLSSAQDDEDFDPSDLIPKYLDHGARDLLALSAALNARNGQRVEARHCGENGSRAEFARFRQADAGEADAGEAEDECAIRGDILQLNHILQSEED
jgi:hypothetical protein